MKTPRGTLLAVLALTLGGCQDAPTAPELEPGSDEAAVEAALTQAAVQAQAVMDESWARMPRDTARSPRDTTRTRPGVSIRTRPGDPERRRPERATRAELMVGLGAEAIALADRLIGEGAAPEQERFLEHAQDLQRRAVAALAAGQEMAASQLAQAASHAALKAVVLPRGVSDDEARLIRDTAADLLRQAQEAVAADPTDAKRHLLAVAEELFRAGSEQLKGPRGNERGAATLWTSATLSAWLKG